MGEIGVKRALRLRSFISSYFPYIIAYEFFMAILLLAILKTRTFEHPNTTITRRWGAIPISERCNRQERTATLLALLLGPLGVDQWYTHHWILAVFKMLTASGMGTWWALDVIMWIVGGVYGTPGCPGGYGGT